MGLRIGTNIGALTALRNLRAAGAREAGTLERLSTGLRITRASDDPSGLVILERLRADLSAIRQAAENTQTAFHMTRVADAALAEVSDRLADLRGNLVAALNTGTLGPEARRALQGSIDATLSAIDRIGATTRFGDQALLNGSLGFGVTNASPELTVIDVQGGRFPAGLPMDVEVDVAAAATPAQAGGALNAVQGTDVTVRITGPGGAEEFTFAAGTAQADVVAAINARTDFTGVEATAAGGIRTADVGSQATLNIEELGCGDLEGIAAGFTRGGDIHAQVDGLQASGRGNTILVSGPFEGEITVEAGATGSFTFTIEGGGARFQLGPFPGGADDLRIGIGAVGASTLGRSSGEGALSDLATGGAGSVALDPGRGLRILDAAAREVGGLRARLGAVASRVFEPNIRALDVAFENLTASRSSLGDADFAEESANAVRERLLRQTGLAVLARADLIPGLVLRLLE